MKPASTAGRWPLIAFALLMLINIALIGRVFFVPHAMGDERLYMALAMKLGEAGFPEYNLHQVGLSVRDAFLEYRYAAPGQDDLLRMLAAEGTAFYNQPLFHQPPLFPYTMMLSHELLARNEPYRVLATTHETRSSVNRRTRFANQFAAGIVPFLSALGLLGACFGLGWLVHGSAVGLLAALLLTISPIYLLAAQRLWPDTTLTLFTTLGLICCLRPAGNRRWFQLALSGVLLGLGLLTKNYAVLAVALAGMILLLDKTAGGLHLRVGGAGLLAGVAALIALPWYWAMTRTFGNPFFAPNQPGISRTVEWFAQLSTLPWYTYLAGIPYQAPLFVLGYAGVGMAVWKRQSPALPLALWFVGWLVALTYLTSRDELLGPEQRYLLPAYPALAVLSALVLERGRQTLAQRTSRLIANALVVALVLAGCLWSLRLSFRHFASGEITLPF